VSVFVNCPTHPDAGLFGPVCGCLHRLGITDPCTPHELTGPDGALVVEVIAGEDVATSGWDGGVLYPYWDVTIVSDEPLVLVHPDQRTTDVPRDWVHTAWIGLPGIGLPGIGLPDEDDANRD